MIRPSWIEMLVSSRARVVGPLVAVAGVAGLSRVAGARASVAAQTSDAEIALNQAIARMQTLESYAFELEVSNGEIEVVPEVFSIQQMSGEVVRPDSFRADTDLTVLFVDVNLEIVTIGSTTWITNPLVLVGSDNDLVRIGDLDLGNGFNPANAVNPDKIALPLLGVIQDPVSTSDVKEGGVNLTRINGVITKSGLESLGNDFGDATISAAIADSMVAVDAIVWIDDEDQVRRFDIEGQMFDQESNDIVRSWSFSRFDVPVVIDRP